MFQFVLLFTARASEHAFVFAKNASLWGRLLSILWWVPKVFPKWSDYDLLREASMKYYNCIKVGFLAKNQKTLHSHFYSKKSYLSLNLQSIVDDQYATFDKTHKRHFMDKYFLEMENSKDDPNSKFFCTFLWSLPVLSFYLYVKHYEAFRFSFN